MNGQIELSVIIPCFNESAVLPLLHERLVGALEKLQIIWEVIFVDDGSKDDTFKQLQAMHLQDGRFKVVSFSRNFGHQAAISAGLAYSRGKAVAVIDADLQDPPEMLEPALRRLSEGYDVVYAVRRKRKEGLPKRLAYALFYRLLKGAAEINIPLDSGDFCVMSRRVVNVLAGMPERNVFVRGLRAWSGFRQCGLEYEREARAAGETKYPFRKLMKLALDGIFSFSTLPLQAAVYIGFVAMAVSLFAGVFVIVWRIFGFKFMGHTAEELPGWTAAVTLALFFSGIQLLILGVIGEYIGRIYAEVKQRPRWVVKEAVGIEGGPFPGAIS